MSSLHENDISRIVVDACIKVHSHFGPGIYETVYEPALDHELHIRGLKTQRQAPVPVEYDGLVFDEGFRADIIVEGKVVLELKSVEQLSRAHKKQLLTYLRLLDLRLGLLINFGEEYIKNGIVRIVNGLEE